MEKQLAPAPITARARRNGRLGFGLGRRFFFLMAIGLLCIVPGFWNVRFLYGVLVWDLLVVVGCLSDFFQLPLPREIEVERHWSAAPSLSSTTDVRLVVRNHGRRTVVCHLTDSAPAELAKECPPLEVRVRPGLSASASYPIRPAQRGDLRLGAAYLRYGSAAQLVERWALADLTQTVRVYPDLEHARRHSLYLTRSRQLELMKRQLRQRGTGREFESLREYREGDEFRDICWSATARRGKLVTKVHQMERSQPVWIVLDAGRLLCTRVGGLSKLDHAANAALCLSQLALYSGDRVGLLAYGRNFIKHIAPGRGNLHMRNLLNELATVRPELAEADHLRAAADLMSLQRRRSLVAWITDLAETAMTPEVIEGASHLLKRHLVLFIVMGQPDLTETADQRPRDAGQMYVSTAAQELVLRRELLLARLRERGALAMEIAPRQLSTVLVNQYLHIKERNLL